MLVGMKAAKRLGIKRLKIFDVSELVIKQVEGIYGVKNPILATYRAVVRRIMEHFTSIEYKVVGMRTSSLIHWLP